MDQSFGNGPAPQKLTHRGVAFSLTRSPPYGYQWEIAAESPPGADREALGLSGMGDTFRQAHNHAVAAIDLWLAATAP